MNKNSFPISYSAILEKIENIDPIQYAKTRNFLNGHVSYLSPYIARGVISLPFIANKILQKYSAYQSEKFLQELAWREYFQRVWQEKNNGIFSDIKQAQAPVSNHKIPTALLQAQTGVTAIDDAIHTLYETGYMHNHLRMYTAMLTCNIAESHWLAPAKWMYYHLLDGDLASNMLSWQWVAGAFSHKKYFANQENINRYTNSSQTNSYLDCGYDHFPLSNIPTPLTTTIESHFTTTLPTSDIIAFKPQEKIFIYTAYNLDPLWHKDEGGQRILLFEPHIYEQYPVSEKVIDFIIQLAKTNIPDIKIIVAPFTTLAEKTKSNTIYFKEHPLSNHYTGICEPRDWLCASVTGYFPSFFNFWKKIQYKF